jgi:co-chaperonin GroES (HSP10)
MLQALKNTVIVKPQYQDKINNIIIPDTSRFGKNSGRGEFQLYHGFIFGVVESIGKDYKYKLQIGDKIIFQRHEGIKFNFRGEEYLKLKDRWVLARINDMVS